MKWKKEKWIALLLGLLTFFVLLEATLRTAGEFYWRDDGRPGEMASIRLPPEASTCDKCPKILIVGDSFTYGVGAGPGGDYPNQLSHRLNTGVFKNRFQVVNGGWSGSNSSYVREILENYLQLLTPDLVLILAGGTNTTNFDRYYEYSHGAGILSSLDEWLFRIRTVRFFRYAIADIRFKPTPKGRIPYSEIDRTGFVASYLNWRSQKRDGDVPLPDQTRADLDLLLKHDYAGAIDRFSARQTDSTMDHGDLWGQGFAHLALGRFSVAEEYFKKAIRKYPSEPTGYSGRGDCLLLKGPPFDHPESWPDVAIPLFQKGIAANPDFSGNHCGLSTALNIVGAREESVKSARWGIARDPNDPRCYPPLLEISRLLGTQESTAAFLIPWSSESPVAKYHAGLLIEERKAASAWMRFDLNEMITLCQKRGIPVMLQDYPHDSEANAVLQSVATDRHVPIVNNRAVFAEKLENGTPSSELFVPDMHCNDNGYALMADNIYAAMKARDLFGLAARNDQPPPH